MRKGEGWRRRQRRLLSGLHGSPRAKSGARGRKRRNIGAGNVHATNKGKRGMKCKDIGQKRALAPRGRRPQKRGPGKNAPPDWTGERKSAALRVHPVVRSAFFFFLRFSFILVCVHCGSVQFFSFFLYRHARFEAAFSVRVISNPCRSSVVIFLLCLLTSLVSRGCSLGMVTACGVHQRS